jgi:hypothetical protein
MYHHFLENSTYAVSFSDIVSIKYWNLIKIIGAVLKKTIHFVFWGAFAGSII